MTEIENLKLRCFDAEETIKIERNQVNSFFQELVKVSKAIGDEQGNVTTGAILERVRNLVAIEEDGVANTEVEPE